eukprot:g8012.t1
MGSDLAASSFKLSERAYMPRQYQTPASGHSSPMHSQALLDCQRHSTSPRRSPVAMDVELSRSPSTVRHRLTIPDLPHRGDESPGHRLSICMSEEFRPLQEIADSPAMEEETRRQEELTQQLTMLNLQAAPTIPLPSHDGVALEPYRTGDLEEATRSGEVSDCATQHVSELVTQEVVRPVETQVIREVPQPQMPHLPPQQAQQVEVAWASQRRAAREPDRAVQETQHVPPSKSPVQEYQLSERRGEGRRSADLPNANAASRHGPPVARDFAPPPPPPPPPQEVSHHPPGYSPAAPVQTLQTSSSVHSAHGMRPEARYRSASEPRLQRHACTMTEGSTTSSNSKERIRALESEVATQCQWIRALEGNLKTAESRAERFEASGMAAQKEIEMTLSQLKSKLELLENKRGSSDSKKMKHSSSEGSIRSSRIADLEKQVSQLTKQLKATRKGSQEDSLPNSERCELLRRSFDRESASQDLQITRGRLRDAENKVQLLNSELAGMHQAQAQGLKQDAEVLKLKQQLQQLEVELMVRKERCSAAEAQLVDLTAELGDVKAARTRTLDQYKGLDSELEAGRKVNVARAQGERLEAEQRCQALQYECRSLKKDLHDTKAALRALDLPHRSSICATARADALVEAGLHFSNLTDRSTSTSSEVDLAPQRLKATLLKPREVAEAKAERTAGALDEARRELKRSQKDLPTAWPRRESTPLAVAVANAIAAKADSPPSRRRQGVRLRIEQEAAERLALGLGPADA